MGSSNPVVAAKDRIVDNATNLYNDIKDDPSQVIPYGTAAFPGVPGQVIAGRQAAADTRTRLKEDAEDKGQRQANADMQQAAAAERAAADAAPKGIDALTMERRRRAALKAGAGRAGTDLTGGMSLGSVDLARKTLLGM